MRKPKRRVRRNVKYVKLAPKWANLVPYFLRILEDPRAAASAKATIRAEIQRLAEFADKVNAQVKKGK
jgi:hypothetical protein